MPAARILPGTGVRGLGGLIVLALAGSASADAGPTDDAKRVQAVIDVLKTGDPSAAVAKLGQGAQLEGLAAHADLVYVLCDRAFRYDNQKANVDARRTLASRLFEVATAAAMTSPDDDRTRWALAEATVLRERAGPPTGAEAWNQAADLLDKVHAAHPTDGLPLAYAVSFLLEGACSDPDSVMPLSERAETLAKKAIESQKDSATLALAVEAPQFWAAKTLVATNKKVAKTQLKAALDTLRPLALKSATPPIEIATAYNDAVSFGKTNGFYLPDRFVTTPRTTLDGTFQYDLPLSSHWVVQTVPAAGEQTAYDYVTELSADGTRKRQILFRRYAWNQRYTFVGTNPVGGDNARSITQGLEAMSAARVFAPNAAQSTPSRKMFPHNLEGDTFDVKGAGGADSGAAGEALRLYAFVIRGHEKACFAVLVYVYGKEDDLDPETEALTSNLREAEKATK